MSKVMPGEKGGEGMEGGGGKGGEGEREGYERSNVRGEVY